MTTIKSGAALASGLALADFDVEELWLRYFALGGGYSCRKLRLYLAGESAWTTHEHDIAAHALNEYFGEHGMDHPVRYSGEL